LAVEPVLIKPVRRHVRGGDDRHATGEQHAEQPPEQHGIGDVGDLELVEAKEADIGQERPGHRRDRIGVFGLAARAGAKGPDGFVHLVHEFMEVHPSLARLWDGLEEEIHKHGLAAPDLADEIGAARRPLGLAQEGVEQAARLLDEVVRDTVEHRGGSPLQGIGRQRALGDKGGESVGNRPRRGQFSQPSRCPVHRTECR
jgi:hypothetical protein